MDNNLISYLYFANEYVLGKIIFASILFQLELKIEIKEIYRGAKYIGDEVRAI